MLYILRKLFLAFGWLYQWKYWVVAREAAMNAVSCGYDPNQRAAEALGLAMLEESVKEEVKLRAERMAVGRGISALELVKFEGRGFWAFANLASAGWDTSRCTRKFQQIEAREVELYKK